MTQQISMTTAQKALNEYLNAKKVIQWLKDNPGLLEKGEVDQLAHQFAGTNKLERDFLQQFELE